MPALRRTAAPALCDGVGERTKEGSCYSAEDGPILTALHALGYAARCCDDAEKHGCGYGVEQAFAATGDYKGARHPAFDSAQLPRGEHGHYGSCYAKPRVDGDELSQREHR